MVTFGPLDHSLIDFSSEARAQLHYELAWDEVDGLGTFFEVELVVEDSEREQAQSSIHALQAKLELHAVETRSYLEMVFERLR